MVRSELIASLMFVTLLAVVAWGIWQVISVRRSQRRHGERPGDAGLGPDPARVEAAELRREERR